MGSVAQKRRHAWLGVDKGNGLEDRYRGGADTDGYDRLETRLLIASSTTQAPPDRSEAANQFILEHALWLEGSMRTVGKTLEISRVLSKGRDGLGGRRIQAMADRMRDEVTRPLGVRGTVL